MQHQKPYDKVVVTADRTPPKRSGARSPRQKTSTSDINFLYEIWTAYRLSFYQHSAPLQQKSSHYR